MVHQTLWRGPKFIYRLKIKALQSTAPIEIVSLTFQKLKHTRRFEKGDGAGKSRKTCSSENCPLIVK
jgi:Fic family protein